MQTKCIEIRDNGTCIPALAIKMEDANAAHIVSCVNALTGIENPEEWVREAKAALKGIRKIIGNSDGVSGWHRNGDLAGWYDEFDDLVGDIDAVLAKTTADDPGRPVPPHGSGGGGDNLPLIDFTGAQFSHGEAVEITGVPSKALNNWTTRKVITLGIRRRPGRRLYSILDLIQLRIVGELWHSIQMPPASASALGNYAIERLLELYRRDEKGQIVYKDGMSGVRPLPRRLVR